MIKKIILKIGLLLMLASCGEQAAVPHYDLVITGGLVVDGTGSVGTKTDLAIIDDRIVKIGNLEKYEAARKINADGLVVSPGFINVLSWATNSLVVDGRGLSDVIQGVTLEVFGEGTSMGPLSAENKNLMQQRVNASPTPFQIEWNSFGEYLEYLVEKGVSPNVASFVGATTVRVNAIGYEDRAPTTEELESMKEEVRIAMEEGALGVGSSLIYAPAFYADTEELIALSKVAANYGGMYISHIRNESGQFLQALDELITISKEANIPAEVYHLKAGGQSNWHKMELAINKIEQARKDGLNITADMYTYTAGATGLDAAMPPWVQEGGYESWAERLQDETIRQKVMEEMRTASDDWENLMLAAGAEGVLLPYFQNPDLKKYTGMTLAAVAREMKKSPEETAMDLVIADGTRVSAIYFLMSEDNLRLKIKQPWLSFGSDAGALDPKVASQFGSTHPRAYGNFARVFAKYVRDENVLTIEDAVRKMTGLPAKNLKIKDRGLLAEGYYADVVIFDPDKIQDHSTFEKPHALSTGVEHVFINGQQVIRGGQHTGATPGRVVRGPGWTGWNK
ncbi:MAG: D-aminoacylase [Gammaproteobacteria bacterium]|nr:D-aminoacylase [Gammaproteobacteria bacterium]